MSRAPGVRAPDRPRVAVYREELLRYSEPYLRDQAEALVRYESVYVGLRRVPGGIALPPERTIVLGDGYRAADRILNGVLRRLPRQGPLRAVAAGELLARTGKAAFLRRGFGPGLHRALRRARPVLLHAHLGVDGAQALPLARRLGVPLVVTFHGYDASAYDAELARWPGRGQLLLQRRAAMQREVARALVVSRFLRDLLVQGGWPPERLTVHYLGVDLRAFAPDPLATPLAERAPIVFNVGRHVAKKGLEYLIDAMRMVRERVPDAELVIGGTGPRRAKLEARAAASGVPVRFVGRLTSAEVREWLARAALYAIPSVRAPNGDSEGMPIAMLEAMACGVPVVGSTHSGIPDAVVDGETGLVVPEHDAAALAAGITALLGDPALRARMGAASRARVEAHFDHARQTAMLETIYDEIVAEHAARRAPLGARRAAGGVS